MGICFLISLNCDYYRNALIILSKTILIRLLGTISNPYTPLDDRIYLLIISLHLKLDCINVYGHLVYDITILRLLQGSVDYTVKNDLDLSSRHHFWPIYTFRSSNSFIDHFIASKNRLRSSLCAFGVWYHLIAIITGMRCSYCQKRPWFVF